MYIKITKSPTSKFSKVYLVEGYRDENGKTKQRVIKCYGNLEELENEDPNIIEKLRKEASETPTNTLKVQFNLNQKNEDASNKVNYGYFFLESIFEGLGISEVINKFSKKNKFKYNLKEILKLLVFERILNPESKLCAFANKDNYFNPFKIELESIYRGLSVIDGCKNDVQLQMHKKISNSLKRDCTLIYYDVTNYYFEMDEEDELRKKGVSKENKRSPIVQMGLFIDNNGIPIAYKLFEGNTHDSKTLIPITKELTKDFNIGRVILTADKGLNSGNNLLYLKNKDDGYIVSQKIRGSSKEFIKKVLEEDGYKFNKENTFKVKSFLRDREVKDENGTVHILKEKVVCYWSKVFYDREKHKREDLEERIEEYLKNPSKYKSSNKHGIKKYLKEEHIDKNTGELQKVNPLLSFDEEKYHKDTSLDGFYAIVTSELELPDNDVIAKYKGLWKIEESFKVIKSNLGGRPVFLSREDRIQAHFLTCFIALTIMRILEFKLNNKYSIRSLINSLNQSNAYLVNKGFYLLEKRDEIYKDIEKLFNVDLDFAQTRIEQIRKYNKEIVHNIFL